MNVRLISRRFALVTVFGLLSASLVGPSPMFAAELATVSRALRIAMTVFVASELLMPVWDPDRSRTALTEREYPVGPRCGFAHPQLVRDHHLPENRQRIKSTEEAPRLTDPLVAGHWEPLSEVLGGEPRADLRANQPGDSTDHEDDLGESD